MVARAATIGGRLAVSCVWLLALDQLRYVDFSQERFCNLTGVLQQAMRGQLDGALLLRGGAPRSLSTCLLGVESAELEHNFAVHSTEKSLRLLEQDQLKLLLQ